MKIGVAHEKKVKRERTTRGHARGHEDKRTCKKKHRWTHEKRGEKDEERSA